MKVGDYVRTDEGIKVIEKYSYNDFYENGHCIHFKGNSHCGILYTDEDIKKMKSSPNIIDLIEVGDYVNGEIIDDIDNNIVAHTSSYGDDDIFFEEKDIKSIVTREQFESMEYKVKE